MFLYRYIHIYTPLHTPHILTYVHTYMYLHTHRYTSTYTYTDISNSVDLILFYFGSSSLKTPVSIFFSNPRQLAIKYSLFKTLVPNESGFKRTPFLLPHPASSSPSFHVQSITLFPAGNPCLVYYSFH